MGVYESIMAGTEVQGVKANLRNAQEDFERRVAEIIGAEATGQGFHAPGFEDYLIDITTFREVCESISERAAERIAEKVQASVDKTS